MGDAYLWLTCVPQLPQDKKGMLQGDTGLVNHIQEGLSTLLAQVTVSEGV